jgi:hypothetical protein
VAGTPGAIYDIDFDDAHDVKDHDGLTGRTGPVIVENCSFCHNARTVGSAVNHVIGDTSNCGECHTARLTAFSTHDHADTTYHNLPSVASGSTVQHQTDPYPNGDYSQNGTAATDLCRNCHNDNGGSLATWTDIFKEHNDDCTLCHNSTRDTNPLTPTGNTIQDVIAANGDPTYCSACHQDKITSIEGAGSIHGDHYEEGWVRGTGTTCIECHDQNNNADHTQMITVIHDNTCTNCHTDPSGGDYSLKIGSSAEGHEGATAGSPNVCTTCHTAPDPDYENDFTTHLVQDHQSTGLSDVLDGTLSNCATSCHDISSAANIVTNTHNNNCYNCHTNTGDDGSFSDGTGANSKLAGTSVGDATGHTIDSTSTCSDCHSSYAGNFSSFTDGHKVQDHNPVDDTANCTTSCHLGGSALNIIFFTHSDCTNCHNNTSNNGQLRVGANGNGDATTHSFGQTSTCATCHAGYNTSFANFTDGHKSQDHDVVTDTATCTNTCHPDGNPANIIFFTHSDCTNCHTNTGTDGSLKAGDNGWGTALPHTAGTTKACADCHSARNTDFTSHVVEDHSGLTGKSSATPVSNCNGCHAASTKALIVSSTHNDTCTNCHNNTGNDGDLVGAGANGYGTTAGHTVGSTSNCAECHSARNSDFETHTHGSDTYHHVSGSGTTVTIDTTDVTGDRSQGNNQLCSECLRA